METITLLDGILEQGGNRVGLRMEGDVHWHDLQRMGAHGAITLDIGLCIIDKLAERITGRRIRVGIFTASLTAYCDRALNRTMHTLMETL